MVASYEVDDRQALKLVEDAGNILNLFTYLLDVVHQNGFVKEKDGRLFVSFSDLLAYSDPNPRRKELASAVSICRSICDRYRKLFLRCRRIDPELDDVIYLYTPLSVPFDSPFFAEVPVSEATLACLSASEVFRFFPKRRNVRDLVGHMMHIANCAYRVLFMEKVASVEVRRGSNGKEERGGHPGQLCAGELGSGSGPGGRGLRPETSQAVGQESNAPAGC